MGCGAGRSALAAAGLLLAIPRVSWSRPGALRAARVVRDRDRRFD